MNFFAGKYFKMSSSCFLLIVSKRFRGGIFKLNFSRHLGLCEGEFRLSSKVSVSCPSVTKKLLNSFEILFGFDMVVLSISKIIFFYFL